MVIRNKKCVKCKSLDVVKIIYGYPSEELLKEAEEGKVKLGGCCIEEDAPTYYCKVCGYEWNRNEPIPFEYEKIKYIKISDGGFFEGYEEIKVDFIKNKISYSHSLKSMDGEVEKDIEKVELNKFIKNLKKTNLVKWKAKYVELDVCDGEQWSVEIGVGRSKIKKYGDNKFPFKWKKFCKIIEAMKVEHFKEELQQMEMNR